MIESIDDFSLQDAVEVSQVDHEAGRVIDRTFNGNDAGVRVPVEVRSRAQSKYLEVLLVAPLRLSIPVRCGESNAPDQLGGTHCPCGRQRGRKSVTPSISAGFLRHIDRGALVASGAGSSVTFRKYVVGYWIR